MNFTWHFSLKKVVQQIIIHNYRLIRKAQNINYFSEEEVNQETNIILNMVKGKSYTEMTVGTVGRDVLTPAGSGH